MLDNSRQRGAWAVAITLAAAMLGGCDPNLAPETPDQEPVTRTPEPVTAVEGDASRNLLQSYIQRDPDVARSDEDPQTGERVVQATWAEEARTWRLPYQAKRIVVALVIAAAHDRIENLSFILTPDARWGWPDPRRPGARPVFAGDGGERFFKALRTAASRLPGQTTWTSFPVPPGIQMLHATGAEPMWTFYKQGNDTIAFHLVSYGGEARIDYIGLFETLPSAPPTAEAYGPSPPLVPPRRRPPGAEAEAVPVAPGGPGLGMPAGASKAPGGPMRIGGNARAPGPVAPGAGIPGRPGGPPPPRAARPEGKAPSQPSAREAKAAPPRPEAKAPPRPSEREAKAAPPRPEAKAPRPRPQSKAPPG